MHTLGSSPCTAGAGGRCPSRWDVNVVDILSRDRARQPQSFSQSWFCSRSSRGRSSFRRRCRIATIERQTATFLDVFRRSTQVLRSAGGLPVAAGEPARRRVPGWLRRAERAVPAHRPGRPIRRDAAARPILKSLAAVDRALLRAAAAEVNKLEKRRAVPRDHRERRAVHRPVRHGVGNPDHVPADRR